LIRRILVSVGLLVAVLPGSADAQQPAAQVLVSGSTELLQKARNPLADLVGFQVQSNFNFNVEPGKQTEYVFNLQANVPIHLPKDWTLITRTIVPLVDEPGSESGEGHTFGIGDIQPTLFFSPPSSTAFIWGFGPVAQFPSASAMSLGSGKWELGPAVAGILTWGSWVVGAQVYNLWSYAGDSTRPAVNQMLLQPLVSYTLPGDWYLTSGPQITADWKASSGDRWTVPVGAGIGKLISIGKQSVSTQVEGYYNVERPAGASTWNVIFTVQLLFP
jgi:hypothetical protein